MFHQITLLCLAAILNAANNYQHSPTQDKIGNQLRYNTPNQYLKPGDMIQHGKRMQSSELQLHDPGRIYTKSEEYRKSQASLVYPWEESDIHKRRVTGNNRRQRRNQIMSGGRGIIRNVAGLIMNRSVKTLSRVANATKNAISWMTAKTMQIGKMLVEVPIQGVELSINAAWAAHTFGAGLTAQIISDTADWFQGNWRAVKTMEFPGKPLIVMLYPSGLMSVVNKITKEIMYMMDKAHQRLTHVFTYTLYISLKIVFNVVNSVVKLSHLNCVKLTPVKVKIQQQLIKSITVKGGKACGISHLTPVNNVTITKNNRKFLIVTTPWVLKDLSVHLTGTTIDGIGAIGTVIENAVMDTTIEEVKATGTVEFEAGTLLRFVKISLKVDSIEGLKVNFPTKKRNHYMDVIEGMANDLSFLLTHEINKIFHVLEEKVYNYIANI